MRKLAVSVTLGVRAAFLLQLFFAVTYLNAAEGDNQDPKNRIGALGFEPSEEEIKLFQELDKQPPPPLLLDDERWDWRENGGVTPVKNQGDCGSCWAFAGVGAFESAIIIADSVEWDLSEQQVVDCNLYGGSCNGGSAHYAYNLFFNTGAVEEECYPYRAQDMNCGQDSCVTMVFLDDAESIPNNVESIKNSLINGPVSSTFTVFDGFHWDCYDGPGSEPSNHAIVIVGWDDNMCDGDGAWICKNSWGASWGDSGYFYIPYYSCGMGRFTQRPIYNSNYPVLTYSLENIEVNVEEGGQSTDILQLGNTGDRALYFAIDLEPSSIVDSFGYYWLHSDTTGGPVYDWVDITQEGQIIEFSGNPSYGNSGHLPLGFDFNYYGNSYNSICVCSNGWASFTDSTSSSSYARRFPNDADPNNIIAPFWANLVPNPDSNANIYFYTNNSDSAVISWVDIPDGLHDGKYTFQIVLVKPNTVVLQYESMDPNGPLDLASTGMENAAGTVGLEVAYHEPFTTDGKAVKFILGTPPGEFDWLSTDIDDGVVPLGGFLDVSVTCDAGDHPAGIYRGMLEVYCNDPYAKHVYIPVNMYVGAASVDEDGAIPYKVSLQQNYPNPFNASTEIAYSLTASSEVSLDVYNLLGQKVETLIDTKQNAGYHSVNWDASEYASGIYLYKLTVNDQVYRKRMTLLK